MDASEWLEKQMRTGLYSLSGEDMSNNLTKYQGDCREILPTMDAESVHCCVTSPPYYGLRDYGVNGQIGLEKTPEEFVAELVKVFREVWRVLRDDGTLWLNLGDTYAGYHGNKNSVIPTSSTNGWTNGYDENKRGAGRPQDIGLKPKDLVGIPWRVAFALQQDGWYLRQDIIWSKPNPMPESVRDRCTKAHEYIFLLSKSPRYYYDHEAIVVPAKWERWGNQTEKKEHTGTAGHLGNKTIEELPIKDTKNKRSVWTVATQPYSGAHFAVFPEKLIEPCILAGCPEGGTVLDPFGGSGTTARVAIKNRRKAVLIELNEEYVNLQNDRTQKVQIGLF